MHTEILNIISLAYTPKVYIFRNLSGVFDQREAEAKRKDLLKWELSWKLTLKPKSLDWRIYHWTFHFTNPCCHFIAVFSSVSWLTLGYSGLQWKTVLLRTVQLYQVTQYYNNYALGIYLSQAICVLHVLSYLLFMIWSNTGNEKKSYLNYYM